MKQEHQELVIGVVILGILLLLIGWICAPREVDGYYLSAMGTTMAATGHTCICAHWTWHWDEVVACGPTSEMIGQLERLKGIGKVGLK